MDRRNGMVLSRVEHQRLRWLMARYRNHDDVQRMKAFIQHGAVTNMQIAIGFWWEAGMHLHPGISAALCNILFYKSVNKVLGKFIHFSHLRINKKQNILRYYTRLPPFLQLLFRALF